MLRWRIIRTLLYKEVLRYRYNWGLLVMAGALLALAALVSVSARMGRLPGQEGPALRWCRIYYSSEQHPKMRELITHLTQDTKAPGVLLPEDLGSVRDFLEHDVAVETDTIILVIVPPKQSISSLIGGSQIWQGHFFFNGTEPPPNIIPYREWFFRETQRFLNSQPRVEEKLHGRKPPSGIEVKDRIPLIETALILFALYLMAFNIYLTSTGEEREKRILMALLLTPARPSEVIAAKGIFYVAISLFLAVAIMAMCHPQKLAEPAFWPTVILGALAYLAIATVFLSIIRRQTTITTVSMLYLVGTTVIMILGDMLRGFIPFRVMLIEHHLHSLLYQIMSEQRSPYFGVNLLTLTGLTFVWSIAAVLTFSRKGIAISQSR
jgi:hypothetical protein